MGKSKSNWAIFGALAVMIFLLLYLIFFGGLTVFQNILQGGSGNEGDSLELPPEGSDCTDLNIGYEFQKEFGLSTINGARMACDAGGGTWTDSSDEISCAFPPPPGGFECADYPWIDGAMDFCVDGLEAFFYCNPNIAYIGCYCDVYKPVPNDYPWNEEELDEGSACENSYPYCDSNCDSGQWCMEIVPNTLFFQQPWCDCVPLYYDTDCTDFCSGQYGYDYGELAHSHYDCDDYEEYIDGCCCGYYQDGLFCEPYVEYYFTEECECPPGYHKENVNRSYWWCVADGII